MNKIFLVISACLLFMPFHPEAQSYSLEQCKKLALENNAGIKNKILEVEASKEVKKAAFTKYFPQVSASALACRFSDPLLSMDIPEGNLPVYDGDPANLATATQFAWFPGISMSMLENGSLGYITATQPIYTGQRISTGNKLANLGIEVNGLQLKVEEKRIVLETEKNFWQIFSLYEKMQTLEGYITMVDALQKEVTDAFDAGLITRNDLLKVRLRQNELQINHSKLTNGLEMAKMAFCQYIGIEYNEDIEFTSTVEKAEIPEQYYTNHQEALKRRDEYLLLQESTDAEKYKTKMQKGEFMPRVAVGVGALYLDIMEDGGNSRGMAFATVNIPISSWWEAKHKIKERHIKEEQNKNMVSDTQAKLLLQMQQGKNMLDEAYKQVLLSQKSVTQAKENLRINQNNYDEGMINVSDLLEAQAQLQQSRDSYTDALSQFEIAKMNYLQMTGR